MQDAHLATGLFVTGSHLLADGSKLTLHFPAELQNLRLEAIHPSLEPVHPGRPLFGESTRCSTISTLRSSFAVLMTSPVLFADVTRIREARPVVCAMLD